MCWGQPSPWLASSWGGWRSQCAAALAGVVGARPSSQFRARTAVLSLRSSRARQRVVLVKGRPVPSAGGHFGWRGILGRTRGNFIQLRSPPPRRAGSGRLHKLDNRSAKRRPSARLRTRGVASRCTAAVRASRARTGQPRSAPPRCPQQHSRSAARACRRGDAKHGHHKAPAAHAAEEEPHGQHAIFLGQHRERVFELDGLDESRSKSR